MVKIVPCYRNPKSFQFLYQNKVHMFKHLLLGNYYLENESFGYSVFHKKYKK